MANTVTVDAGGLITIVPDGATDVDFADYFPNGIYLRAISFVPSATTDALYMRVKSATGVQLIPPGLSGGDGYVEVEPTKRSLYMKASDCTFGTPASCLITVYFD